MATIESLIDEINTFALFGRVKDRLLSVEKNTTVSLKGEDSDCGDTDHQSQSDIPGFCE